LKHFHLLNILSTIGKFVRISLSPHELSIDLNNVHIQFLHHVQITEETENLTCSDPLSFRIEFFLNLKDLSIGTLDPTVELKMKSTHHVVSGLLAYHVNHGTACVLLDLHVLYYFKIRVYHYPSRLCNSRVFPVLRLFI
jgi:hypothetical protein